MFIHSVSIPTVFVLFFEELVFLGDAKFGVKMNKDELSRCEEHSCTPEKLALNILEYLVTPEDCRDMTVYGCGKRKPMDPAMRKAIRSMIFYLLA